MSLSQSPNRFRDITVSTMATPGKVEIHHEPVEKPPARWFRPSDTMPPQLAVGGGTPAPRKLNVASSRITMPTWRVATTIRVFIVPGNM